MSNKDAKSFKVPKIRREESKDNLRQVEITSRDCIDIVNTVKRSYLDSTFETVWQLKTAAVVENRELEVQYRAKKAELKEEGRNTRDLVEHFAFVLQRDNTIVPLIVRDGLKCKSVYQSLLGDSKLGVYLWRNADIQLRLAESWKVPGCTLIVFKIVLGKCKALAQQHTEENIEPTPNFDCHVPQSQPRLSDNFTVQLARSQVYLYEYTEDCEPSPRPRQCLPYAVLTYEKADNIPRSLTAKVDSYSKRPKQASWATDSDTKKTNIILASANKRDPRLGQVGSNINSGVGAEVSLCVPHLTAGPPPRDLNTKIVSSISDPDDPRSQLSFLTSSANNAFQDFTYQPSFGPSDSDDPDEFGQENFQQQEPLTSLPPLKLPLLPDPLIPPNSQIDTRYTDPRFGYVDSSAFAVPSEPRLRPKDPRLHSTSLDPRLKQMQLDPRKPQGLTDPRLERVIDPRLKLADPRVQQTSSHPQEVNFPVQQRISNAQNDDASKTRKKLSLNDYKKKVNISKPENSVKVAPLNSDELQNQKILVSSDVKMQFYNQPVTYTQRYPANITEQRDPRLFQQSNKTAIYSHTYSNSFSEQRDPRLFLQVSNQTDAQGYTTGISEQRDPRLFQQSSANTPQYYISSPEKQIELSAFEITDTSNEDNIQANTEDDIVKETDDMAKTLNELSDPDDISQSPKQFDESVPEEPKIDDPMLAAAMQKLVEHSGNVTLFTEALRMLQESAEEFGEQLADPEFLVKKIAEKIEELSKLEAHKLMDSMSQKVKSGEIQEINSPDLIMSPDLSNDSKSDNSLPVKHIPLESVESDVDRKSNSKLDQAMQKTLEELDKIEKSQSATQQRTSKKSNKGKAKKEKKECSFDNNLLDIPIPPEPAKQTKTERPAATQIPQPEDLNEQFYREKHETKLNIVTENEDAEDDDADMKITQILPSLTEQKETKKRPVISFNFKRKIQPPKTVLEHCKDDIDLRVKNNASTIKADFEKKKETYKDEHNVDLIDKDFRKGSQQNKGSRPNSVDRDDKAEKNNTKIVDIFDCSDLDKRENIKKEDIGKGLNIKNTAQKSSVAKFVDPFGLDDEVIDDRNSTCESNLIQKKEVNDFGDIDWRHASGAPVDVDMRSTDTSTENSQCSELGDFDLRQSHSRSVSPTQKKYTSNKLISSNSKQTVKKFVDPFGLDEDTDKGLTSGSVDGDTDQRLISRSNSPLLSKENVKSSRTTEIAADNSQDSNPGSGVLFDAYSLGKSKSDDIMHASNEFGDFDWRQTAAAEMGDVDLRSVSVEKAKFCSNHSQGTAVSSTTNSVINTKTSDHNADPFQQMNKNLLCMFNTSHAVPQYQTSDSSYNNYSTSHSIYTYGSYTTSKSTISDDYNTNTNDKKIDVCNYTTNDSQQTTKNKDGFHNMMQNLDFSSLKNILAKVQIPTEMVSEDSSKIKVETDGNTSEQQEEHNRPAFVTGLSSVNMKPDESRKFEPPAYKQYSSPNKEDQYLRSMNSEKPLPRIPGFDISPEKEINEGDKSAKNFGNSSNTEMTDSIWPEKEGGNGTESKPMEISDSKVNESLPSTPKDKLRRGSEDVLTPLPNISYQAAILESIEQSALKIRNDDSFTSEMEESPIRIPKREKSKQRKIQTEVSNHKAVGTKRSQDYDDENASLKLLKRKKDTNITDAEEADEDDEESGLVIDLSPGTKTVNEKVNSPVLKSKDQLAETVDLTDDAEPALVIDDNMDMERSDDLHVEDTLHAKSKDEMTDMIEKSRKNMVIKIKGQTKLVNPKTGKAYDKIPKGSTIEVFGQTSVSKETAGQQIHPIHGVIPIHSQQSSTSSSWQNSKQADTDRGQPIHAITAVNSGKSIKGSKTSITASSLVSTVPGDEVYGEVSKGQAYHDVMQSSSDSAVFESIPVCIAHSSFHSPSVSERVLITGTAMNTSVSPVTLIAATNPSQTQSKPLEYVHPFTGRTVKYGQVPQAPVLPVYGNASQLHVASVPLASVPMPEPQQMPEPQPVPPPVHQLLPPPIPQPVPPPSILSQVSRPVLIVPGQNQSGSVPVVNTSEVRRLPFLPTGLGRQRPGVTVQTVRNTQTLQMSQQVHTSVQPVRLQTETSAKVTQISKESKPSTDVFDCFRDKFEKRETKIDAVDQQTFEAKTNVHAGAGSDSKNAYSVKLFLENIEMKARKELNAQGNSKSITTMIKTEQIDRKEKDDVQTVNVGDVNGRKRPGDDDSKAPSMKKVKKEFESKPKPQKDFGSRILESLTEVKNKLRSPEKRSQSPEKLIIKPKISERKTEDKVIKDKPKKETFDSGASSELEDGEISEDSMSESEEPVKKVAEQYVHSASTGSNIPVLGARPGQFNKIQTIGSWGLSSPNRNMNICNNAQLSQYTEHSACKIGADWADIIQHPEARALERVKATNIESPSLRSTASASIYDTASIVSKSAASISKSRQKSKAQSQVKTLGEWLKLELEIDNIAPLQSIIPYALDTDLTKIPKQRKRRIRMKVKNAIEQEGTRAISFERKDTVTVEVLVPENEPLNPNYLPEVSNEQTGRELQMLGTSLNLMKERIKQQATIFNYGGHPFQSGSFGQFGSFEETPEDKKMIIAMTLVESEMRTHLSRACFYGYPHRRVPDDLLLNSELGGFKSEAEEVFLILMMPLSAKPYNRLLQLRNSLKDLYDKKNNVANPGELVKIEEEIRQYHNQRQAALRGFTGYLNKKRIQKLQETVEKYTLVYDYFKMKTPPTPDSMLRFIRTTQMDLRQHLILARQYLALEEQKLQ